MAERKKNPKAEAAMEIAEKFKDAERHLMLSRAKLMEAEDLLQAQGGCVQTCVDIRDGTVESSSQISAQQSHWHNIAYDRGYYETVEVARKLSKSNM